MNLPENAGSPQQRAILDALPVLVFLESAGQIVFANAAARQMLGLTEGKWAPCPVEDVLWGLYTGAAEPQTLLTGTPSGSPFHATMPAADGHLLPVEGIYSPIDAHTRQAVIVAHPGDRERVPKTRLIEDVLSSLPEAVAIEHDDHILYTNQAFSEMFGYSADEAGGGSLRALIVPETRFNEHATLRKAVDQRGRAMVETVRTGKAGDLIDVSLQIAPLLVDGVKVGYVYSFRDIGERKSAEARLQHDAMHDPLTGLPNRALFQDRLSLALSRLARRPDLSCGVLYLDLDHFKEVNDALGHAAGDMLLKAVAKRLNGALRPQDSAARLGGDEFAVLVENIASVAEMNTVGQRLLHELERPFEICGHSVHSGASIGMALAKPGHTAADMLLRDADFAMYRAKQLGGGQMEVFDRRLEVYASSQQERERELRAILKQRQFAVWYQPVFRLTDGRLEGFEASLCWQRADGAITDFRDLMTMAEEKGMCLSLARETLEAVCAQLRNWTEVLPGKNFYLSVNLTPRQFYQPGLLGLLNNALEISGADPGRLVIEIPESAVNESPDAAIAILQRMIDSGVRLALDDFGSSLGSLNHLVRQPFDILKLDSRITASAATAGRQQALLDSLVRLGATVGVEVVAQGIETPEQLKTLLQMGCVAGQGPMLSAPLDTGQAQILAQT